MHNSCLLPQVSSYATCSLASAIALSVIGTLIAHVLSLHGTAGVDRSPVGWRVAPATGAAVSLVSAQHHARPARAAWSWSTWTMQRLVLGVTASNIKLSYIQLPPCACHGGANAQTPCGFSVRHEELALSVPGDPDAPFVDCLTLRGRWSVAARRLYAQLPAHGLPASSPGGGQSWSLPCRRWCSSPR
ncbi:MAG: hypothetical protein ACLTW6_09160 [Enterobacter sp.]